MQSSHRGLRIKLMKAQTFCHYYFSNKAKNWFENKTRKKENTLDWHETWKNLLGSLPIQKKKERIKSVILNLMYQCSSLNSIQKYLENAGAGKNTDKLVNELKLTLFKNTCSNFKIPYFMF